MKINKEPNYFDTEIIFDKTADLEELTSLRRTLFNILQERTESTLKKSHLVNNADNYLEIYVQCSSEDLDEAYLKSNRFMDKFIDRCNDIISREHFISKTVTISI